MQIRSASNGSFELNDRTALVPELDLNIEALKRVLGEADDVSFRPFLIGGTIRAELVNIPSMSNRQEIDNNVLKPLMQSGDESSNDLQSVKMRLLIYLGTSHVIFDFFNIALGLLLFLTAWIRSRKGRRQAVAESNAAK